MRAASKGTYRHENLRRPQFGVQLRQFSPTYGFKARFDQLNCDPLYFLALNLTFSRVLYYRQKGVEVSIDKYVLFRIEHLYYYLQLTTKMI